MDLGSARTVPMICVHGGPGIDSTYLRMSALSQIQIPGVEVVFVDLPGHGAGRSLNPEDFTLESCADAVLVAAEALGAYQFDLLGHSFGGFVALHTTLKYPERVRRLILVGTSAGPVKVSAPLVKSDEETALYFRQRWPAFFARNESFWNVFEASTFTALPFNRGFAEVIPGYDVHEAVRRLPNPTILIAGDRDGFLPAMKVLESEMSNAALHVIPDCGHMPFLEAPGEFSDALLQFYTGATMEDMRLRI